MQTDHPNIELVHLFYMAYESSNHVALQKILAYDVLWHVPTDQPLCGTKKGLEEVLDYLEQSNMTLSIASQIVVGVNDKIVIDCHCDCYKQEQRKNIDNMCCLLWKIENNRITEVFIFPQNKQSLNVFLK